MDCKEVVVSEPRNKYIEYVRIHRPHIRFIENGAEFTPIADENLHSIRVSLRSIIPRICP